MSVDKTPESLFDDIADEELFFRYSQGRELALRDELFARHLRLVEVVAHTHVRSRPGDREDLLQVGYLGLLGAIERFDWTRGVKFATYAGHCIHGEIRHFVRDKGEAIRRPRWMRQLSSRVASFLEGYLQEHARLPTLAEISEGLNITLDGVVAILRAKQPLSLDGEDVEVERADGIRSLRHVSFRLPIEDRIVLEQAVEKLLELERKVVYLFFVRDLTQKQIAGELSLPPRKVSRVMQSALGRLRRLLDFGEVAEN